MRTSGEGLDPKTQTLRWLWSELETLRIENCKLMNILHSSTFSEEVSDEMVGRIEERLGELTARVAFESRHGK